MLLFKFWYYHFHAKFLLTLEFEWFFTLKRLHPLLILLPFYPFSLFLLQTLDESILIILLKFSLPLLSLHFFLHGLLLSASCLCLLLYGHMLHHLALMFLLSILQVLHKILSFFSARVINTVEIFIKMLVLKQVNFIA